MDNRIKPISKDQANEALVSVYMGMLKSSVVDFAEFVHALRRGDPLTAGEYIVQAYKRAEEGQRD